MSGLPPEAVRLVTMAGAALTALDDVQREVTILLGSRAYLANPEFQQVERVNAKIAAVRNHLESMMVNAGSAREKAIIGGAG